MDYGKWHNADRVFDLALAISTTLSAISSSHEG